MKNFKLTEGTTKSNIKVITKLKQTLPPPAPKPMGNMEALTLTEEHKAKLLEMCNKLFPDPGKWHFWENDEENYALNIGYNNYAVISKHKDIVPALEVHWFEFCMTHLAEKIIATYHLTPDKQKVYSRDLNDRLSEFYLRALEFSRGYVKVHPIDNLYEQFKKLK